MQIGMIGLGRMGANMVRRLMRGGHAAAVHDRSPEAVAALAAEGAVGCATLDELVAALEPPRNLFVMVPAAVVDAVLDELAPRLASGDAVVDGGNSHYPDDLARAARLASRGVHFLDMGTSGGVHGLERGYCLMIGGERKIYERLEPVFRCLAPGRGELPPSPGREGRTGTAEEGFLHCGPVGAGHFVKMVHNGIEYGMMQALAEGFALMKNKPGFELDVSDIAELWRHSSVVQSWLLDLSADFLAQDQTLENIQPFVGDSGEGRWTALEAIEQGIPAPVMTLSLMMRFASQGKGDYANKMLAKMRQGFGGHAVKEG